MLSEISPLVENTTGDSPRILIVEDDETIGEFLSDSLRESLNAQLRVAGSARQALEMDGESPAEVVVLDYLLPDMDGLELISALGSPRHRPMILMTGHPTLGRAIEAMRLGVSDMFVKPFDLDVMTRTIVDAVCRYRTEQLRIKRLNRVRKLSKQMTQDRRDLRRKVDLLCRDLVEAYRELAEKVNKLEK